MTDKEFKRLSRAQLIDIIYQFQLQLDKLTEQNQQLEHQLADKRIRLSNVGNIAEAALEINVCFKSAQNAADQYLNEIKLMREEAEAERKKILEAAHVQAQEIIAKANKTERNCDLSIEAILKEFKQSN